MFLYWILPLQRRSTSFLELRRERTIGTSCVNWGPVLNRVPLSSRHANPNSAFPQSRNAYVCFRRHPASPVIRADKGWAVKRARPSKKVWCRRLGLCLEMSLVFDFGQGLRCGLSIRHCRCHWIVAAWFVFLHFFLVPLCWYAVSERQMLLFFAGGLVGVDKHLFQKVSLITSMTLQLNYIFVILLANVDVIPNQKQLSTV